jgi:arylsulfatase A-like enzyme
MMYGPARRLAIPTAKTSCLATRCFFASCLVAVCVASAGCGGGDSGWGTSGPRVRNVIVLLADTLRADHLGTYGYGRDTSPNVDALGRRGVVFERTVSQASCTFPSVNSLLTSRYPYVFLGRPAGEMGIPDGIPGLAEVLSARGFDTVAVSASPIVRKSPGEHNPNGGFGRGFDVFDESCEWGPSACVHARALEALDTLHAKAGEPDDDARPFFLYLHYMDPHDPYWRPPEMRGRFAGPYRGEHPFVVEGDPNPIGEMLYDDGPQLDLTEDDLRQLVAAYDEAIAYFDGQLALFLDELERRGLLDDTLVALVADHGEEFLEHGHIKHCRTVYDTEIKTPLILVGPGVPSGRRVSRVVENLDLVPTVLDYLGIEPEPGTPETEMVGTSLRPLIEGREPDDGAGSAGGRGFTWQATQRSLTEERYKLIVHLDGRFELYDLATDPGETRDVLRENRRTFARLRDELVAWMHRMEPGRFGDGPRVGEDFEEKLKALGYLN